MSGYCQSRAPTVQDDIIAELGLDAPEYDAAMEQQEQRGNAAVADEMSINPTNADHIMDALEGPAPVIDQAEEEPDWARECPEIEEEILDEVMWSALTGEPLSAEVADQIPAGAFAEDQSRSYIPEPAEIDRSLINPRPLVDPDSPCADFEGVCTEVPYSREPVEEEDNSCLIGSRPEEGHNGPSFCFNLGWSGAELDASAYTNITDGTRTDIARSHNEIGAIDGANAGDIANGDPCEGQLYGGLGLGAGVRLRYSDIDGNGVPETGGGFDFGPVTANGACVDHNRAR
ncbi:MAG: hypothetical protein HN348_23550 [Proteobacteria bacterium]|jgi:hypothetical protein|nr:hypothetical protein [Pseudomonadota bacterium]